MLRTYLLAMLIVCLMVTAAAQAAPADEVLPAGTLLQCTLDEPNFSSRTGQIDDPVLCHLGAVVFFGHSLFPRGAYLAGRFRTIATLDTSLAKGGSSWCLTVWSYPVR